MRAITLHIYASRRARTDATHLSQPMTASQLFKVTARHSHLKVVPSSTKPRFLCRVTVELVPTSFCIAPHRLVSLLWPWMASLESRAHNADDEEETLLSQKPVRTSFGVGGEVKFSLGLIVKGGLLGDSLGCIVIVQRGKTSHVGDSLGLTWAALGQKNLRNCCFMRWCATVLRLLSRSPSPISLSFNLSLSPLCSCISSFQNLRRFLLLRQKMFGGHKGTVGHMKTSEKNCDLRLIEACISFSKTPKVSNHFQDYAFENTSLSFS